MSDPYLTLCMTPHYCQDRVCAPWPWKAWLLPCLRPHFTALVLHPCSFCSGPFSRLHPPPGKSHCSFPFCSSFVSQLKCRLLREALLDPHLTVRSHSQIPMSFWHIAGFQWAADRVPMCQCYSVKVDSIAWLPLSSSGPSKDLPDKWLIKKSMNRWMNGDQCNVSKVFLFWDYFISQRLREELASSSDNYHFSSEVYGGWIMVSSRAGVPSLWDLMPDGLRWSWCNNNRNKMHNKCNALESSWNHLLYPSLWKNCLPWNWPLVPRRSGTDALLGVQQFNNAYYGIQESEDSWRSTDIPQGY